MICWIFALRRKTRWTQYLGTQMGFAAKCGSFRTYRSLKESRKLGATHILGAQAGAAAPRDMTIEEPAP